MTTGHNELLSTHHAIGNDNTVGGQIAYRDITLLGHTVTAYPHEMPLTGIGKNSIERQDEYLVIACKSYDSGIERAYKNIKIKKIPQFLLGRCEFGKDNYNLTIVDVPVCGEEDDE